MNIYNTILNSGRKLFGVLIDPDKYEEEMIASTSKNAASANVDFFLVGGSLITNNHLDKCITIIKENCKIPVILFPGSVMQIHSKADAILLLSLISGRNPDLLIGKHVIAAPYLKESGLEILPTGYMLIESGKATTALYISNTTPIPRDKEDIAACTALAGEMLGLKLTYLDAGSGAEHPVPQSMITRVRNNIASPIIVGGGIKTPEAAVRACKAGADMVVVGNAIEKEKNLILELAESIHSV